ncbi:hypothetical protein FRC04_007991 [Tulasnella sp. 424]|nr:hypothetical protein FRC04_007991 [Tulasnella sp. 424]KAG8974848.1 hypothetical protein FRC05_006781 [Tulasnella sp. 425]
MEPQLQSTPVSRRISTSRSFSTDSASDADSFIKDELVGSGVGSKFELVKSSNTDHPAWGPTGEFQHHPPREISFIPLGKTSLPVTPVYADGKQVVIGTSSGVPRWMGTLPFMSTELLRNPNAIHKVGFEVEVLVCTLLWIVRVHTEGEDSKHDVSNHHRLGNWFSNKYDLRDLAANKCFYLTENDDPTNELYKDFESEIRGLRRECVKIQREVVDARWIEGSSALVESLY